MFTRYDGYQKRYDRPEKYFWQSMDKAVDGAIRDLNSFDLLYLTDVLNESLGTRLEGAEIVAGGTFSYNNDLERIDDEGFNRSLTITKSAGVFGQARWFKNLSLKHQLGFTAYANRMYPLDSDTYFDWNMDITAKLSWLWNLTDRFLLATQLINRYNAYQLKAGNYNHRPEMEQYFAYKR